MSRKLKQWYILSTKSPFTINILKGPMGFGTMCAADPSGNAAMCPGYTGSPLVCPDQDGNLVLAGLQSYTWSCLTPVWDMICLLEMKSIQSNQSGPPIIKILAFNIGQVAFKLFDN